MKNIMVATALALLLVGCGGGSSKASKDASGSFAYCRDGTTTESAGKQGACSSHGGLATTSSPNLTSPVSTVSPTDGRYFGVTDDRTVNVEGIIDKTGNVWLKYVSSVNGTGIVKSDFPASFNSDKTFTINYEEFYSSNHITTSQYAGTYSSGGLRLNSPSLTLQFADKGPISINPGIKNGSSSNANTNNSLGQFTFTLTAQSTAYSFTGTTFSGCAFSGILQKNPKSYLTAQVTFGKQPCPYPNQILNGQTFETSTLALSQGDGRRTFTTVLAGSVQTDIVQFDFTE
jgi:hypothetical protein